MCSEINIGLMAVVYYLQSRRATFDCIRDTIDVTLDDNFVTVNIHDKVSGGKTSYASMVSPAKFEALWNSN